MFRAGVTLRIALKSIASEIIQAVKGPAVGFPGNCLFPAVIIISFRFSGNGMGAKA